MGCCDSKDEEGSKLKAETAKSRELENRMGKSAEEENTINKLLLLGAGESGKSTLFKQMIKLYGSGFTENEKLAYVPVIQQNIILSAQMLVDQVQHYGGVRDERATEAAKNVAAWATTEVDASLVADMKTLWADDGIQETYRNRAKFQLTDGTAHFFDEIDRVTKPDSVPTHEDILRCRVRTTGIVENEFVIEQNKFRMFDVGGQRNERKKWISCFEDVTAVIFVAAISAYDQTLFEDEKTNRMQEAILLFSEICNSVWFKKTDMILFLNKKDLFKEKVEVVSIRAAFPEYSGADEYDEAKNYIISQFEAQNKDSRKKIYTHVTCATDGKNVEHVFKSVRDIVIRSALDEISLT